MTPKEFTFEMQRISKDLDLEGAHREADDLMCRLLVSLGYEEGIEIFQKMEKWYA